MRHIATFLIAVGLACATTPAEGAPAGPNAVLAVGSGAVLLSGVHDIATVTERVRERNRAEGRVGISFAPMYRPDTRAAGMTMRVAF